MTDAQGGGRQGENKMIIETNEINNGVQILHRFANNYGASVVRHEYSYGSSQGLWEIAVAKFDGDDWNICYDTSVTDDVLGWQSDNDVTDIIAQIEAL